LSTSSTPTALHWLFALAVHVMGAVAAGVVMAGVDAS
jgi:hypothetical protein